MYQQLERRGTGTEGSLDFEDVQLAQIRDGASRKTSSGYSVIGSAPLTANSLAPSTTSGMSLAALQEIFKSRDDDMMTMHAGRKSDVSSVASSLIPQNLQPFIPLGLPPGSHDGLITPPSDNPGGERDYLNSDEEMYYMQVFVRDVAIWMDSLDYLSHFSRVIPYQALKSPMLLNALLSCGVKHLTLVDSEYKDDKALYYYDTATTQLLSSLQNPDRNTAECATTAVILNVYEIMSEKPTARMSHIAGARALIRECGWNAKSTGIGAACFWINIGMEVLSCLSFNWQTAWDPEQWGIDLSFTTEEGIAEAQREAARRKGRSRSDIGGWEAVTAQTLGGDGEEEVWVHRIFYIVAKIANFRANIPRFQEPSPHDEQVRLQNRFAEWKHLKALCDTWNDGCPRPMRPFGYGHQQSTRSRFPNVW
jgi:hypothetical protein